MILPCCALAKRMGKRVFFDIDDAPSRAGREISQRNAATMMREAHGVFAGSHNLEALAQETGGTVHFIPSGVRLAQYKTRARKGRRTGLSGLDRQWRPLCGGSDLDP